jgi:hypothetical protein
MFQMQVKVGQQVTEERVAARPSASVSATRDGDIGPGSRNPSHTVSDHRTHPSAAGSSSNSLWEVK